MCRTGGMASCIFNFGDVWMKSMPFKVRPFVPTVRIPAARKTVRGGGSKAAVSKQIKRSTHLAQYVELVESHYAA